MKKLFSQFLILGFLVCLFSSFKQESNLLAWQVAYNQNGIKISYEIMKCNGVNTIFFKIENSTAQQRIINGNCFISEGNRSQNAIVSYMVNANSTSEMKCGDQLTPFSLCTQLLHNFTNPTVTISIK